MTKNKTESWVHRHPPVWRSDIAPGERCWYVPPPEWESRKPVEVERWRDCHVHHYMRHVFHEVADPDKMVHVMGYDPLYRTEAEALDVLEARLFSEAGKLCAKYEIEIRELGEAMERVAEWREEMR